MKINVVTVTYGKRFNLLKQVLDSVIIDKRVDKVILVDNGSDNPSEIDLYVKDALDNKVILIRNKNNKGSAGGFRQGIIESRSHECDYVLLLDDDNAMESGWSDYFSSILDFFPDKDNLVFKGNRHADLNLSSLPSEKSKILRIDYLSFKRIKKLFSKKNNSGNFWPALYMVHGAIAYGGALIPYKAILEVEPPLEKFYLYSDDVEYLFRMHKAGYKAYQLSRPFIYDLDQTFSDDSSHLSSFEESVSLIKLFFMTRNAYALVIMTKSQSRLSIIISGIIGISAKIIYAFIRLGVNKFTRERAGVILRAFFDGVRLKFNNEEILERYKR